MIFELMSCFRNRGLGKQESNFQNMYYEQAVRKVQPKLVIPIHWDDFTKPLTDTLEAMPKYADNTKMD